MEQKTDYKIGQIVELRKPHTCDNKNQRWEILRKGADFKLKCSNCGEVIVMPRGRFNKKIAKIVADPPKPETKIDIDEDLAKIDLR